MEKHYCDSCKTEIRKISIKFEWKDDINEVSTGLKEFDSMICLRSFINDVYYELGILPQEAQK